jgi:hypothetical protein
MLIATLIAIGFLAAAVYWWRSRLSNPRQVPQRAARRDSERFAGVEIRRRSGGCAAAIALDGQRFLANRSPALPLVGCTKKRCDCTFVKYSDRRTDDRRWENDGTTAALFNTAQRRMRADRRDTPTRSAHSL